MHGALDPIRLRYLGLIGGALAVGAVLFCWFVLSGYVIRESDGQSDSEWALLTFAPAALALVAGAALLPTSGRKLVAGLALITGTVLATTTFLVVLLSALGAMDAYA